MRVDRPTNPPRWETQAPIESHSLYRGRPDVWIRPQALDVATITPETPLEGRVQLKLQQNDMQVMGLYESTVPTQQGNHEVKVLLVAPNQTQSLTALNHTLMTDLIIKAAQEEHPLWDPSLEYYRQPVDFGGSSFSTPRLHVLRDRESVISIGRATLWGTDAETERGLLPAFTPPEFVPKLVVIMYPTLNTARQAVETLAKINRRGQVPFAQEYLPLHAFSPEELRMLLDPKELAEIGLN